MEKGPNRCGHSLHVPAARQKLTQGLVPSYVHAYMGRYRYGAKASWPAKSSGFSRPVEGGREDSKRTCPPSSASWEGYLHCCASMPRRTAVPVVLLALLASLGGGAKPEPAGSERSPPCGLVVVHPRNLSRPLLDGAGLALRYCTAVPDASCHRLVASCALSSPCRRSGPHAPDAPGRMAGHAAPARH
jgi:hypothetical protein